MAFHADFRPMVLIVSSAVSGHFWILPQSLKVNLFFVLLKVSDSDCGIP